MAVCTSSLDLIPLRSPPVLLVHSDAHHCSWKEAHADASPWDRYCGKQSGLSPCQLSSPHSTQGWGCPGPSSRPRCRQGQASPWLGGSFHFVFSLWSFLKFPAVTRVHKFKIKENSNSSSTRESAVSPAMAYSQL